MGIGCITLAIVAGTAALRVRKSSMALANGTSPPTTVKLHITGNPARSKMANLAHPTG